MAEVILVDKNDKPIGIMEKLEVHKRALLHRAFSVFIFNSKGEMLLQQRASGKYHNPGLWSNTCCSHPKPGELTGEAAKKRLSEEMGFTTELDKAFSFTYRAVFDNGLTEHEYDHVFIGEYNGAVKPDPQEVMNYRYTPLIRIKSELISNPENFTEWFKLSFKRVEKFFTDHKNNFS
ncbi:isopentenyl-diphosphate Delta-isomerase [soil metagenome]